MKLELELELDSYSINLLYILVDNYPHRHIQALAALVESGKISAKEASAAYDTMLEVASNITNQIATQYPIVICSVDQISAAIYALLADDDGGNKS